ncbi:MAG: lamin tail domain-containing protein, partial [Calditrichaeota bacterium]|nr:lamin tail domain-containing protein [Calditrichota bacterium]
MKFSHIILFSLLLIGVSYSQNHLLISEIQVAPGSSEFIEIFNPNSAPVTLDNYYLSDYNTYYEVVNNQFTSESSDFLVKFPDGSRIDSAGVVVVAVDGSSFTGPVDFEIRNTSAVTDMTPLYVGSTASLSNAELVILFYWDGQGDLVSDVDYAMWGDLASNFIDKTGVSIDGQDPDPTPSAYLNDTPVSSQMPFAVAPISGKSMGRISVSENGEIFLNGNGINGHDETSEPVGQNFSLFDTPNPGTTELQIPTGNGSGIARVTPDSVMIDTTVTLQFSLQGTVPDTVTDISLEIPVSWNWSGNSSNVQMGGSGLSGAILNINGNVVGIASAEITLQHSGVITIDNLISPSQGEQSVFEIQTAISGGTPIPIAESPVVTVYEPMSITPIADIQANPSGFTQVTIDAIVVLGAGKTATGWTDAYVQDNSGAGINIYQGGSVDSRLVRGNRVLITGTVVEFISSGYKIGVTEITDYTLTVLSTGNALPDPLLLTTQEATNTDLEGTFVEVSGEVTDFIQDLGGGSNIRLDDGSGECLVRVWNSTGVNLSGVAVGEQLVVRGPLDIYQDANQLLLAYQEDLEIVQGQPGDGSGTASVSPDSVGQNQSGIELNFSISGESPYVLETVSLTVPADWQWTGSQTDVTLGGGGFAGSQLTISGRTITVTQASISSAISGELIISGLISPNQNMLSTFSVKTAVSGGILSPIDTSPTVTVGQGVTITPIADIQANPSGFTQVTIDAIVVLGAGKTTTSWTDAYVQDNSGAGINIYQGGSVD